MAESVGSGVFTSKPQSRHSMEGGRVPDETDLFICLHRTVVSMDLGKRPAGNPAALSLAILHISSQYGSLTS